MDREVTRGQIGRYFQETGEGFVSLAKASGASYEAIIRFAAGALEALTEEEFSSLQEFLDNIMKFIERSQVDEKKDSE